MRIRKNTKHWFLFGCLVCKESLTLISNSDFLPLLLGSGWVVRDLLASLKKKLHSLLLCGILYCALKQIDVCWKDGYVGCGCGLVHRGFC